MSYSNHTSLRDNEIHEEIHHSYTLRIQIFFQIEHAVLSLKADKAPTIERRDYNNYLSVGFLINPLNWS